MKDNRIWIVRLALVVLMLAMLCTTVSAAGSKLVVKPTTVKTDEIWPGQTIYLCQITHYDGTEHQLTEGFANSHLSISALLTATANKYAAQIRDYAVENKISAKSAVTGRDGNAVFSGLECGLYVVYAKDATLFTPFVVNMGTADLECEPKVDRKPDPDPTEPTDPTDPTDPTKPPKPKPPHTGDDAPVGWLTAGLVVGLAGLAICAMLPLKKHRKPHDDHKTK